MSKDESDSSAKMRQRQETMEGNVRNGKRPNHGAVVNPLPLELAVVGGVANVAMDTGRVDLVAVDLATSELRHQHSGIDRALLLGKVAELLQEPTDLSS